MVLIECYTEFHIDNMASCLRLRPETMILVGDSTQMGDAIKRYEQVLRMRRQNTRIRLCDVARKDFAEIYNALVQLIVPDDEYVIDMTGGDEPVIMAVGALLASTDKEKLQQVCVQTYDHQKGLVYDNIHDNMSYPSGDVKLSVEELLLLHGGKLHPDAYQPGEEYRKKTVAGLWQVVAKDPKRWNRAVTRLAEFESRCGIGMHILMDLEALREDISNFDEKWAEVQELLKELDANKAIRIVEREDVLEYNYCSSLMRYCLLKAGNVLEVKTLLEGREVLENGKPYFCDGRMSVNIDWDGVIHKPKEKVVETRNEVDVIMMCGLTPLFISCKNGSVSEEELYKLNTVADRFGGPYARKMLVVTDLDRGSEVAERFFVQRAWDMDIFLVREGAGLTPQEWRDVFKQAVQ